MLLKSEYNDTLKGADAILMQKEVKAAKRRVAENRKKKPHLTAGDVWKSPD